MKYQEFKRTPQVDEGCALFYKEPTDTHYHILIPLETVPAFSGDKEEIDYGYTTMSSRGLIDGRRSLNSTDTDFYWVRDFTNKLKELKKKQIDFLVILPDYQGYKVRGSLDYTYNEITVGELAGGTLTITPSWMDEDHIDDVSDLIQETATITEIDPIIYVSKSKYASGYTLNLPTDPYNATGTISYGSLAYTTTGSSNTSAIATGEFTQGTTSSNATLKITPLAVGREIIKIETSAEGYASWATYITINVTE